jgi:hypothetical protein
LWQKKYINWGRQRVRGHLRGYRGSLTTDFREQMGIYVLSDKDMQALYIGQVGSGKTRLFDRLKQHTYDHLWNRWEHFSWLGLRRVNKDGSLSLHDRPSKVFKISGIGLLNEIEAALMTTLEPHLNKQGPRWKDADEYFQEVDEDMDDITMGQIMERHDDLEEKIAKIAATLKKLKA